MKPQIFASSNAPTIDAPLGGITPQPPRTPLAVALVEGSTPELSAELHSLLRNRLRTAALLLALGFGVFFVRSLFLVSFSATDEAVLCIVNGVVAVILTAIGAALCRHCPVSAFKLRSMELLVFGLPAMYFLVGAIMGLQELHDAVEATHKRVLALSAAKVPGLAGAPVASESGGASSVAGAEIRMTESPVIPWLMLIFLYAMYIPNTWQRAAAVIGAMALAPVLMIVGAVLLSEPLSNVFPWHTISAMTLVKALTAVSSVWGVYTMGRLRAEAFEARQMGQYRLTQRLGAGGMGEVWLAEHQLMKRPCAIKIIRPGRDRRSRARCAQRHLRAGRRGLFHAHGAAAV